MTEIDFDELDKAVNALIKNDAAKPVDEAEKVSAINDVIEQSPVKTTASQPIKSDEKPVLTRPLPVIPIMAPPVQPQNVPRPKGRFMDMVRKAPEEKTVPVVEKTAEPVVEPVNNPVIAQDEIVEQKVEEKLFEAVNNVEEQSLESPFLANAKIEKRPLGAFSDSVATPAVPNDEFNFGLQEELTKELLSVESSEEVSEPELAPAVEVAPEPQSTPEITQPIIESEQAPKIELKPENATEISETEVTSEQSTVSSLDMNQTTEQIVENVEQEPVESVEQPANSNILGSIQQQYQETPVVEEPVTGSIYDTNDYHKAIPTNLKNNPKIVLVVWISLLLLVGAGTGALMYFFVLPLIG